MQVDYYLGVSSLEMDMWGPFLYTSNLNVPKYIQSLLKYFQRKAHPTREIDVSPAFLWYSLLSLLTLESCGLGSSLKQLILLKAECYNISFNIDELFSLLKGHSWKEFVLHRLERTSSFKTHL